MSKRKRPKGAYSIQSKLTAFILCLGMVLSDIAFAAPLVSAPVPTHFSIPKEIASIELTHQGHSGRSIIYIEDAHDSLEAQERIADVIDHLVSAYGVQTVFEEGYEGRLPTDDYFAGVSGKEKKQKLAYFFLDKLRLGGAEYAHINRKHDFDLIGVDDRALHAANIAAYSEVAKVKVKTEKDLNTLLSELKKLSLKNFPAEVKKWMKLKRRFSAGSLELIHYLKRTRALLDEHYKSENYPLIDLLLSIRFVPGEQLEEEALKINPRALFSEMDRLENHVASAFIQNPTHLKTFLYLKNLEMLIRLNEIEVTAGEFDALGEVFEQTRTQDIARFIAREAERPVSLSKRWEKNIQKAVEFYALARARDVRTEELLKSYAGQTNDALSVLVFGGFHKSKMHALLKKLGYTIYTVTPRITQISETHQKYYKQIMGEGTHNFEIPLFVKGAAKPFDIMDLKAYSPDTLRRLANHPAIDWSLEPSLLHPQIEEALSVRSEARGAKLDENVIRALVDSLNLTESLDVGAWRGEFAVSPASENPSGRIGEELALVRSKLEEKYKQYKYQIHDNRRTGDRDDIRLEIKSRSETRPHVLYEAAEDLIARMHELRFNWNRAGANPEEERKLYFKAEHSSYYQWITPVEEMPLNASLHFLVFPTEEEIERFPELRTLTLEDGDWLTNGFMGIISGDLFFNEAGEPSFLANIIQTGDLWRALPRALKDRYDAPRGSSRTEEGYLHSWYGEALRVIRRELQAVGISNFYVLSGEGIKEIRDSSESTINNNIAAKMYGKPAPSFEIARVEFRDDATRHRLLVWAARSEVRRNPALNDPHWKALVNAADHLNKWLSQLDRDLIEAEKILLGEVSVDETELDREFSALEIALWGEKPVSGLMPSIRANLSAFLEVAPYAETLNQAGRIVHILNDPRVSGYLDEFRFWEMHYEGLAQLLQQFQTLRKELSADRETINDAVSPLLFPIELILESVHDLIRNYPLSEESLEAVNDYINLLESQDLPHNPSYNFVRTVIRFIQVVSKSPFDAHEANQLYGAILRFEEEAGKRRWVREIGPVLERFLKSKNVYNENDQKDPLGELEQVIDKITGIPSQMLRNESVQSAIPELRNKLQSLERAVMEPGNRARVAHAILDFAEALSEDPVNPLEARYALDKVRVVPQFGESNAYTRKVLLPIMEKVLNSRSEVREGPELNFEKINEAFKTQMRHSNLSGANVLLTQLWDAFDNFPQSHPKKKVLAVELVMAYNFYISAVLTPKRNTDIDSLTKRIESPLRIFNLYKESMPKMRDQARYLVSNLNRLASQLIYRRGENDLELAGDYIRRARELFTAFENRTANMPGQSGFVVSLANNYAQALARRAKGRDLAEARRELEVTDVLFERYKQSDANMQKQAIYRVRAYLAWLESSLQAGSPLSETEKSFERLKSLVQEFSHVLTNVETQRYDAVGEAFGLTQEAARAVEAIDETEETHDLAQELGQIAAKLTKKLKRLNKTDAVQAFILENSDDIKRLREAESPGKAVRTFLSLLASKQDKDKVKQTDETPPTAEEMPAADPVKVKSSEVPKARDTRARPTKKKKQKGSIDARMDELKALLNDELTVQHRVREAYDVVVPKLIKRGTAKADHINTLKRAAQYLGIEPPELKSRSELRELREPSLEVLLTNLGSSITLTNLKKDTAYPAVTLTSRQPSHGPGVSLEVSVHEDLKPGRITLIPSQTQYEIYFWYPIREGRSAEYQVLNRQGIAATIMNWLAWEFKQANVKFKNNETVNELVMSLYARFSENGKAIKEGGYYYIEQAEGKPEVTPLARVVINRSEHRTAEEDFVSFNELEEIFGNSFTRMPLEVSEDGFNLINAVLGGEVMGTLLDENYPYVFKRSGFFKEGYERVIKVAHDEEHTRDSYRGALAAGGVRLTDYNARLFDEAIAYRELERGGHIEGLPEFKNIGVLADGRLWIDSVMLSNAKSLREKVDSEGSIELTDLWNGFIQLANIIKRMHTEKGYLHNDIKPENILMNEKGEVQLIDFDIAVAIGELSEGAGSEGYKPTDKVRREDSDIFSFLKTIIKLIRKNIEASTDIASHRTLGERVLAYEAWVRGKRSNRPSIDRLLEQLYSDARALNIEVHPDLKQEARSELRISENAFYELVESPQRKGTLALPVASLGDLTDGMRGELLSAISNRREMRLVLYNDSHNLKPDTLKWREQFAALSNVVVVSDSRNEALQTWGLSESIAVDLILNEEPLDTEFMPGERIKKLKHVRIKELGDVLLAKLIATVPEDQIWWVREAEGGVMELLPGFRSQLASYIAEQAIAWSA